MTFLQVYLASHPTASNNNKMNMILARTAKRVFGTTMDHGFVQSNGLYDKIFLDCSFQDHFMMNGKPLKEHCDMFQQMLTSNGICMSFNSEIPSNIWQDDIFTAKAIEELAGSKPREISNFIGAGPNQGMPVLLRLLIHVDCRSNLNEQKIPIIHFIPRVS